MPSCRLSKQGQMKLMGTSMNFQATKKRRAQQTQVTHGVQEFVTDHLFWPPEGREGSQRPYEHRVRFRGPFSPT